MKIIKPEDIDRLPKWAQEHISHLNDQIVVLNRQITEMSSVHEGSNVTLRNYVMMDDVTLPDNSRIHFHMSDKRESWVDTIVVYHRLTQPGILDVHADGILSIRPAASNAIELRIDPR